jgi:vitamin B12 transporter
VLAGEALALRRAGTLGETLDGLPGVSATGFGPQASRPVIRGLDGDRVRLLDNGGASADASNLSFDHAVALDPLVVERIEVLRGPAAAVYGSDAIGGVVHIVTRRGEGRLRASASVSSGSFNTQGLQAAVRGSAHGLDYALSASAGRSDGFNARPLNTSNPDSDGWRRGQVHARAGWAFAPGQRVEAAVIGSHLRAQYDGSLSADDTSQQTLNTVSLGWAGQWAAGSATRATLGQSKNTYETQPSYYRTETTLRNLLLSHEQTLAGHTVSATLERREDGLLNPATASAALLQAQRSQNALALAWRTTLGHHALQAHVRHDDDSEFGGHSTGSLAWGWAFTPDWRATASVANSFRVPTVYQRFSQYGVATLKPESGRNLELGLRWAQAGQAVGLVAWRNRVSDLIVFAAPGPCAATSGCYGNVGRAQYDGLTLSTRQQRGALAWHASVDWHLPRNQDTQKRLARRAQQLATLGVDAALPGFTLGLDLQAASQRWDDAANKNNLGGYALLGLVAQVPLGAGLSLDLRVDNATDTRYQLARTYATAGRSAQASLRWALP